MRGKPVVFRTDSQGRAFIEVSPDVRFTKEQVRLGTVQTAVTGDGKKNPLGVELVIRVSLEDLEVDPIDLG